MVAQTYSETAAISNISVVPFLVHIVTANYQSRAAISICNFKQPIVQTVKPDQKTETTI